LIIPPQSRGVTIVPQDGALFSHLTVGGNVAFGLKNRRSTAARTRVKEVLEIVGLAQYEKHRPSQLSGGMQQRVAIDNKSLDAGKAVDAKTLVAAGVIARTNDGISLINTGTLKGKVNLTVSKASKGAIAAVEKAGGKVDVLPAKVNKLLKPGKTPKRQAAREVDVGELGVCVVLPPAVLLGSWRGRQHSGRKLVYGARHHHHTGWARVLEPLQEERGQIVVSNVIGKELALDPVH